jgi:hypothetical protein
MDSNVTSTATAAAKKNHFGPLHRVRLHSGDIIIFGNQNRMMYHGIKSFYTNYRPKNLHMISGRINITLRHINRDAYHNNSANVAMNNVPLFSSKL